VRFLPRDDKYFGMLNQLATQVRQGGELFVKIFEDSESAISGPGLQYCNS
jgi:hypothetical protein